jgi:hypothetical protein
MIMVHEDYSVRGSTPGPYMPGLGQGHEINPPADKKRHIHAFLHRSFLGEGGGREYG